MHVKLSDNLLLLNILAMCIHELAISCDVDMHNYVHRLPSCFTLKVGKSAFFDS